MTKNCKPKITCDKERKRLPTTEKDLSQDQMDLLNKFRQREPWNAVPLLPSTSTNEKQVVSMNEHQDSLEDFKQKISETDSQYWQTHFKQFCTDACLLRYLRANNWILDNAFQALIYTLNWRRKYQPHLIISSEVSPYGQSGKQYHHGYSKYGHPILYLRNHLEDCKDYKQNMRLFVYHIEHLIRAMPEGVEKIVLIFDFSKWTPSNNPPMHVSKYFLHLFASHYPERLAFVFNCNAPWMFWAFYKVISPFVNPVTRAKFRFVQLKTMKQISIEHDTGSNSNILNFVDEDELEEFFGGGNSHVFNPDVYWQSHEEFYQDNKILFS